MLTARCNAQTEVFILSYLSWQSRLQRYYRVYNYLPFLSRAVFKWLIIKCRSVLIFFYNGGTDIHIHERYRALNGNQALLQPRATPNGKEQNPTWFRRRLSKDATIMLFELPLANVSSWSIKAAYIFSKFVYNLKILLGWNIQFCSKISTNQPCHYKGENQSTQTNPWPSEKRWKTCRTRAMSRNLRLNPQQ